MNKKIGQAGLPNGWVGYLFGHVMAWHNRLDAEWTVDLLAVSDADCVLEVGFGPGLAIKRIVDMHPACYITGIDHSKAMLNFARKLNRAALDAGRVELALGSAEALPFAEATFDKAFTINCIYFWPELLAGLRELYRVLKPGGCLAVTVRESARTAYEPFRMKNLVALSAQAGFTSISVQRNSTKKHPYDLYCWGEVNLGC